MDDGSPWAAVTAHDDLLRRPGQGAEIIQYDVETHARGGPVSGGVAQEYGAEGLVGHCADVALHQRFACRVSGLRIHLRALVNEVAGRGAINAAGGGIYEPADSLRTRGHRHS